MDKINIGFVGGCINNQVGISRDDLYYSVLIKHLKEGKNNSEYQISLGSYLSFDQLVTKTNEFISKKKPNIIFLFIRPFPLMPLQKPFVKYERADGSKTRTIHPALFRRHLVWKDLLTKNQKATEFVFVPKSRIGLRDLNLIAGIVLGLHHWTKEYVANQILLVKQLCDQNNIQLKIISPPQNPESIIANLTCKWITSFIDRYCRQQKLEFININKFDIDKFEQDKIHFNIHGHQQLGQLIHAELTR
jgi:hypothetical protein